MTGEDRGGSVNDDTTRENRGQIWQFGFNAALAGWSDLVPAGVDKAEWLSGWRMGLAARRQAEAASLPVLCRDETLDESTVTNRDAGRLADPSGALAASVRGVCRGLDACPKRQGRRTDREE